MNEAMMKKLNWSVLFTLTDELVMKRVNDGKRG